MATVGPFWAAPIRQQAQGALYAQFDSKVDLFLTLLHRRIDERA